MPPRPATIALITLSALVALTALAGCGADDDPSAYDDRIDPATGRSAVEAQWLDRCLPGLQDAVDADVAADICGCAYVRFRAEIPFSDFVEAYDQLELDATRFVEGSNDPSSTEAAILEIVLRCIGRAAP